MSGFRGFGTPATGSGIFGGAAKPPDQGSSGFTIPTTTTVTTNTGVQFGSPASATGTTAGLFGAQTPTGFGVKPVTTTAPGLTGFKFGTPTTNTQVPAFGVPSSNTATPAFGASSLNTATPTFGVPSTSTATPAFGASGTNIAQPTFGAPAVNKATPAFGASTTSTAMPTFSGPSANTAAPQNSFGALTSSTTIPTFGTFGNQSTSTFTAGVPKTTAFTGLSLPSSTQAAGTPAPSFNFGVTSTTTTTSSSTLTFGINTTAATTTPSTSTPTLSFGVPAAGASTATTTPSTSASTFTQPATSSSLTFGTPKTTGGFNFNAATTKTVTFNLGNSTPTDANSGGRLFRTTKTTENVSTTTTATTSVGLGGVDYTQGLSGPGTLELKHAKDNNLPSPILQTLNDFQNFTKQQKSISVEISHGSSKPLLKVQEDTEGIESLLTTITSSLRKNAIAVDKLKMETAQGLHQAEMAQRNHETPPGLDYDNSASFDYFNDLVTKFERDIVRLRVQIEASEKHLRSLTQCSTISPQELTLAMRRLHETLVVLAAQVQALHTTVQSQKEQFKNLRRVYFKDETNVFESETNRKDRVKKPSIYSPRSLTGPTPFSEMASGTRLPVNLDGLAILAGSAADSKQANPTNQSWISPLQRSPDSSGFGSSGLSNAFPNVDVSVGFLSKPATGNKRTKR